MCWDGDRGLAVGRQTADAVLRHQTSQSRISLSCLLALSFSLSLSVTHTQNHEHTLANTTTHISSDLAAKTQRLGRTNTHTRAGTYTQTYTRVLKSLELNFVSQCWNLWDMSTSYMCGWKNYYSLIFFILALNLINHRGFIYSKQISTGI